LEKTNVYTKDGVEQHVHVRPCTACGDELAQMLHAQRAWQIEGMETRSSASRPRYTFIDPAEPPDRQTAMEYLTYNVLALQVELGEMLNETGWKPWSTSNHVNAEALGEWIDAWHFMMNILWVIAGQSVHGDAHVLATIVHEEYAKKREINLERQRQGYDGVSSKCTRCKRDFAETSCTTVFCAYPMDQR
jgi:hypothetical protein